MWAARQAPAAYIGPTQYSQMIWAVLLGYVLFGDRVDPPMVAGMVLIEDEDDAFETLTVNRQPLNRRPVYARVFGRGSLRRQR